MMRLLTVATRHPVLVLLATTALWLAGAAGLRHLELNSDYRAFFAPDDPHLQAFDRLQHTYSQRDNILLVVAAEDGDLFRDTRLEHIRRLTEAAWQLPYSIRVDSITNFQHTRAFGDELVIGDLLPDPATGEHRDPAQAREIALREPMLVNRLVSADGTVAGVNVVFELPEGSAQEAAAQIVAEARALAARLRESAPDLAVHLTGVVMMNNAFYEASRVDLLTLFPLMFVVILILSGVLLRSWAAVLAVLLATTLPGIFALGVAGWLGIALTPPSLSAPIIILTLAVADCVHLLIDYQRGLRDGLDRRQAIGASLRVNLQPVLLTSLTTAIGFVTMNFSASPPFHDLGNIVAIGVLSAFGFVIIALPAILVILPQRLRRRPPALEAIAQPLGEAVIRHRKRIRPILGSAALALVACIGLNELNDDLVAYFDERVEFRRATDFTTEHLTGIYSIDYSLGAGSTGGIHEPAYLATLDRFAQWLRQQPEVLHVSALSDVLKRLSQSLHGDDPAFYRLPDSRELAAQYLLLYEMSLPNGLDLNDRIDVAKSATRLTVSLRNLSSNEVLDLEARAQAWLAAHAPAHMQTPGTSPAIMFSHIGRTNIQGMLLGTTVALVLISAILLLALRSARLGLISLVPNLLPAGMAFGLWGLFSGQVNLGLSVVSAMTLGIVVDDTIHFLTKYARARRESGGPAVEAVRYAYRTVGPALIVTTLVLVIGFAVLAFSSFEKNAAMGLLTAVTLLLALGADLILLPTLLIGLDRQPREVPQTSVAARPEAAPHPLVPAMPGNGLDRPEPAPQPRLHA